MLLQCSNCAGSVTANEKAIRRGVVMCEYCYAVLRITRSGVNAYKKRFLKRKPPDGIRIRRNQSETKIFIPTGYHGTLMPGLLGSMQVWFDLIMALIIGVVAWFFIRTFVPFYPTIFFITVPFFLFARALSAYRYLELRDGILKTYIFFPIVREVPVADIKQFYVTQNRILGGEEHFTQYQLFALMEDGNRMQIYGSFPSLKAALYVEEWLEIELDIFNLPVYGEVKTTASALVVFKKQPDTQISCYACAAPLAITAIVRQQGYITCTYCHTITLLYPQAFHKPVLGQPNTKNMGYKVTYHQKFAGVLWKEKKQAVLLLSRNKIIRSPQNPKIQGKLVRKVGVRESIIKSDRGAEDLSSRERFDRLESALAYSQDLTLSDARPLDMGERIFNIVQYTIIVQIGNKFYPLIRNMEDLHEAAFIVTTLNAYLKTLSSTTMSH